MIERPREPAEARRRARRRPPHESAHPAFGPGPQLTSTMPGYLDRIDRNTPGPRDDVSPLFADRAAFAAVIDALGERCDPLGYDAIAGIDALGFVLGAALARRATCGLIVVRKAGCLPVPALQEAFMDYTGTEKMLELRADLVAPGARVLVVDEWIETGAQASAAARLIERAGGLVVGIATIHADGSTGVRALSTQYPLVALTGEEAPVPQHQQA